MRLFLLSDPSFASSVPLTPPLCQASLTPVCTQYYHFMLSQGVLFGIASALIFTPVMSVPGQWFPRRRALATAITMSGSGLGGTLWPIALQRLFASVGFGWAMRIVGFICLGALCGTCALVRERYPRRKPAPLKNILGAFKDTTYVLVALGAAVSTLGYVRVDCGEGGRADGKHLHATVLHLRPRTRARRLVSTRLLYPRDLQRCLLLRPPRRRPRRLGWAVSVLALPSPSLLPFLLLLAPSSSPPPTFLTPSFNLLVTTNLLAALLLLTWWAPLNTLPALIAFAVIYSPVVGMLSSLYPACVGQVSPPDEIGARVGMMYALCAPFTLAAPPVSGALVARFGERGFLWTGVVSGIASGVGGSMVLAARMRIGRWREVV